MPSTMMHLSVARYYRPDGSPLFFVGNVAPDCIDERERKDELHLRTQPDRDAALRQMATRLDLTDDFQHGALLHLYADYRWDMFNPQKELLLRDLGERWFLPYRREISEAGNYIFRHTDWGEPLWARLEQLDSTLYDNILPEYPAAEIYRFIVTGLTANRQFDYRGSNYFSPEYVDEFCINTAKSFSDWEKTL